LVILVVKDSACGAPAAGTSRLPSPQAKKKPRHRARQFIREETPRKGEGVNRRLVP